MNYDIKIDLYGNKYYYVNNVVHREDGPAVEFSDGTRYWCKNGLYHRDNGPAIETCHGTKIWYKEGNRHREDGPAIEYSDGNRYWYLNDKEYGYNNDFTNKSWQQLVKTLIFS